MYVQPWWRNAIEIECGISLPNQLVFKPFYGTRSFTLTQHFPSVVKVWQWRWLCNWQYTSSSLQSDCNGRLGNQISIYATLWVILSIYCKYYFYCNLKFNFFVLRSDRSFYSDGVLLYIRGSSNFFRFSISPLRALVKCNM